MSELVFEITQEADGGFVAEALGESILTQPALRRHPSPLTLSAAA